MLGNEKKSCHCGAAKCAGLIGGKYKQPVRRLFSKHPSESNKIISIQIKQPQPKAKLKSRRMTNLKLKSPKRIRKLKPKEAAMKGGKRAKLATLIKRNHISPIITDSSPEKDKPQVSQSINSVVDSNSNVSPTQAEPSTSLTEEKQIEDTQS